LRIRGDHDELAIEGRLDVRTAADARSVLHRAVDHGHGDLVLDLSALDSWDATGLGVLMGTHRRAGRCGRRMVLRGIPAQLQRLLVATKLHRILAIEGYVPDLAADLAQDLPGGLSGELPGPVLPVSAG
jgi:anti-anti-sigma factor